MLTRRHIRVKVMQSIYAFTQSHDDNLDKEVKFINNSVENMYSLYLIMLDLFVCINKAAEEHLNKSQKKYLATAEEKQPNKRFVENRLLQILRINTELQEQLEKRKLSNWKDSDEYVNLLLDEILKSEAYQEYMNDPVDAFKQDRNFLIKIFREIIAPNDKLYDYLEDERLTWLDDLPVVNHMVIKTLKQVKPNSDETFFLPKLYKDLDDKVYAKELFTKTVLNQDDLLKEIEGKTPNWDKERIADVDMVLLKMAICEFLKFPSIPVKVTINEYLEIAKEYSTPKSSIFINGILDKLVKEYQTNNSLNKSGRGLM